MKTIGLVGGTSWTSTLIYYKALNELVQARLGGSHSARIAMWSVDFAEHLGIHESGGWKGVEEEMIDILARLKSAGAEMALLCANTLHMVYGAVEGRAGIPILHIADAAGAAIQRAGIDRIGLIGTRHTMGEDFYRVRLRERYGIETIIPEGEDFRAIDDIIFRELVMDRYEEPARARCLAIIDRLVAEGARGIVLGCTELPKLVSGAKISVPVFDTLQLHAEAAVEEALR